MTLVSSRNLAIYDDFLSDTGPDRLQKIFARYELFKLVQDVPGDIVECGVFKGSGIYTWAKLMRLFKPHNEQRIIAFDFFEMEHKGESKYVVDDQCIDAHAQGWASQETLTENCKNWGFDKLLCIAGDVTKTAQAYARDQLGARIALLYLDVDNYEGTLACLQHLYPLVVRGGIIAFDEYALSGYGESDAVDEFFSDHKIKLRSFGWANTPTAFVIKE